MAPDQFSRTLSSAAIEPIDTSRSVTPTLQIVNKKVERQKGATEEKDNMAKRHYYSELRKPEPELWDIVIEAVDHFNENREIKELPYAIRIWAQSAGFRVQLIIEETGEVIKQTPLINFKDVTEQALNGIINSLIGERGVVIDLVR